MGEIKSLTAVFLGLLFWTASLILATDAFLVNMQRTKYSGWEMLYFENAPMTYQVACSCRIYIVRDSYI